jgi:hypothetical protein
MEELMSQFKKSDPLEDWLYKLFKIGLFLTGLAGIYQIVDKELQINEFVGSFVNLRLAKFSCLVLSSVFALYLQNKKPHRRQQT